MIFHGINVQEVKKSFIITVVCELPVPAGRFKMGKINFEEYRQPWETGPHWELKREFMEKYQDDFPEDRLLCLAQAYSNIELLHCSYPDPVMLQIHELSKPLNGLKRFREATKNFSKDEPELQTRAAGKRSATDDLKKPFKFIKFYSAGNQSSEVAGSSTAEENTSTDAKKSDTFTEDSEVACDATPSMVPLDTISTDTQQQSTTEDNTSVNIPKSNKDKDTAAFSVATPSVVQLDTNTTSTFKLSNSSTQNEDFILSLSQSPDLNLINTFSKGLSSLKKIKSKKPIKEIERTVDLLDFHGIAHYKFEEVILDKASVHLCKFFIKDTLISIGRCVNKKMSQISAAFYAVETLEQFSNLPVVALSNLNCNAHKENVLFLHKFLQEAKRTKPKRETLSSVDKIMSIIDSLKCPHERSYFYREDIESPLNENVFYVDIVINKVLICTGKNIKKAKAKSAAADEIIPLLQKFFNEHSEDFQSMCKINADVTMDIPSEAVRKSDEQQSCTFSSKFLPQMKNDNSKPSLLMDPTVGTTCFKINYKILRNSIEKRFAVFDMSEISSDAQTDKPQKSLFHSAQFCKKVVSFDAYINNTFPSDSRYKCDITFEGENIAVGEGSTKAEAKTSASLAALKSLEQKFYTIKVKSEVDESFVIKRDQIINAHVASEAVSDSNVGCKMLKMMGWTGGGIGKTESGITEPITSSDYRFQQGLGFADKNTDEKKFRHAIESCLKEFSQADTISDLVFSTDFTKDERKIIHKVSQRFGLLGSSRGRNEKRQLFVKHKMSVTELINYLIRKNGCTPKYELVDKSS
ncbi:hypothetical protein JTE90_009403 [Oedothorax gibbosus]|uniref:NF-kappa-B-repressing factor n=1 Tax=Oedothorax gibbosus TaxID=931172 RepID=A0AAV6VUS0_9ARAC|nr:hypothetical protein JTE90_009403 [Oedothorax gibbosus]